MLATVTDPSGSPLTRASIALHDGGIVSLEPARKSRHQLFDYYFHRGGRKVVLDVQDAIIRGALRTTMDGTRRRWWIVLEPASRDSPPLSRRTRAA